MNKELRTMGKVIKEYVEKNVYNTNSRQMIDKGAWSAFLVKHHINFDNSSKRWCFRSARLKEVAYIKEYCGMTTYEDRTKNIGEFIEKMMECVRSAVNNYGPYREDFLSYSKYLAAPLFKYNLKNGPLIIDELNLNTLDLSIDVHCFDWIPGPDRHHIEEFEFTVPFKDLSSHEKMSKHVYDEELSFYLDYKDHLMDVDDITFAIPGVTLDISSIGRTALDNYYNRMNTKKFKRLASYQKDHEVLTTRRFPSWKGMLIEDPKAIQLIRLIYIFKVCSMYNEKVALNVELLLENKHPKIVQLFGNDIKAIRWVQDYLDMPGIVGCEEGKYLYTRDNPYPFFKRNDSLDKHRFCDFIAKEKGFEPDFLKVLLDHVFKQQVRS
ncbi:hypothetical protein [Paenibacillus sp. FSL R7-0333]|uniref:hypothetical protein n=1 Tax=Paenibacillus sp. FSL R7-0333 TaxID=1926587 RepID=UPI00117E76A7